MGSLQVDCRIQSSIGIELGCGSLLRELETIWTDIGETEADKDRMLLELERECMQVYKRKVDEAFLARARLYQSVAAKEAELAGLRASLAEHATPSQTEKITTSLMEKVALLTPMLEELRAKKDERTKQFTALRTQIEKINNEISGYNMRDSSGTRTSETEDSDLSLRKLDEMHEQLKSLQKEKSDRLQKVLQHVNEVHSLCVVLGMDFQKAVEAVHPTLQHATQGKSTNISNGTLDGLAQLVLKLKSDKKTRMHLLRETVSSLYGLWKVMDSPEPERRRFGGLMFIIGSPENDITDPGVLSLDILEQTATEVERLNKIKASRMKELVFKKRAELEEICRATHIEPDTNTDPEKSLALIDSGILDPTELLSNMEAQISKAKEESISRKDIMDRVVKWLAACEEENWLEEYNQDKNRYNAGKGTHLNLKRAERARITASKIPGIVDSLINQILAWEDERDMVFMYDGARLVSILEEYKVIRQEKEEEKKRLRDQKKLQSILEKEHAHGSRSFSKRSNSFGRSSLNGSLNGSVTPTQGRFSPGGSTPELLTPRSFAGRQNGYFKETRLSSIPLNRKLNW